jgi:hypothetical protein
MIPRSAARHNPQGRSAAVRAGSQPTGRRHHERPLRRLREPAARMPRRGVLRVVMSAPGRLNAAGHEMHRNLAGIWTEIDRDSDMRASDDEAVVWEAATSSTPAQLLQAAIVWQPAMRDGPKVSATYANIRSPTMRAVRRWGIDGGFVKLRERPRQRSGQSGPVPSSITGPCRAATGCAATGVRLSAGGHASRLVGRWNVCRQRPWCLGVRHQAASRLQAPARRP